MVVATGDMRRMAILFAAALLAGCAADTGRLDPRLAVDGGDIGMGKAIYLHVRDDRRHAELPGAPFYSLGPVLKAQLAAAYEAQDFRVLQRMTGDPCELTVDLMALEQQDLTTSATLRALARKGRESYAREYPATLSGAGTDGSARMAQLDQVLTAAMTDLARDPALLDFLLANCNRLPDRGQDQTPEDQAARD